MRGARRESGPQIPHDLIERHLCRGTKIISVFVERTHLLAGFQRRTATLRAIGSRATNLVSELKR